ncbi:MAG: hypothetical protein OEY93_04275, partial [Anaerolineae bacterium]|nr:hypothetical protein [Anaerolineae bacterium]
MLTRLKASGNLDYYRRETALILLWAYVILAAGPSGVLANYRVQVGNLVLAGILIGGWLLGKLRNKERIQGNGLGWGFILFYLVQILAVMNSMDFRRSLTILAIFLSLGLAFYYIQGLLRRGWPAELVEKTLLIVGAIVIGLALMYLAQDYLNWLGMAVVLEYAPAFEYRLFAVLGDANLLADFVMLLVPVAAGRIYNSKARLPKIGLGAVITAGIVVMYFASSRGAFMGLAAALGGMAAGWVLLVWERGKEVLPKGIGFLRKRPAVIILIAAAVVVIIGAAAERVLGFEGDATHAPVM